MSKQSPPFSNIVSESVRDFCRSVGIGRTKFYSEVAAGRISVLKCGRKTLVSTSEKLSYLERIARRNSNA